MNISGQFVDIPNRRIFPAIVTIDHGIISAITPCDHAPELYIMPGFIDAHIHIESSMLIPSEFAKLALSHGTIGTVSDPHEIANVLGIEGINFMIENAKKTPLKIMFGAPSCVPATHYETSGAIINSTDVKELLSRKEIGYLSEMMNFPGVLQNDPEIISKIQSAIEQNKPIDGHAPGLRGNNAKQYIEHGISTDHECISLDEALEKISYGMKILIREGSAAKNFDALHSLISTHPLMCMFCSDDKHPDSLLEGHINSLVIKAIHLGYDLFDVLSIACINPVKHYSMPIGLLQIGDPADIIITTSLTNFIIHSVYIDGINIVAQNTVEDKPNSIINKELQVCNSPHISEHDLNIYSNSCKVQVIKAIPGQIVTDKIIVSLSSKDGILQSSPLEDILKIVVINRYTQAPPAIAFITGFGIKQGAIASTIAHDSHNIIAIGADDLSIVQAVNALIDCKGGISLFHQTLSLLPLEIAGLMSNRDAYEVAAQYIEIDARVKETDCIMPSPFMALSFMALLVIPTLKLSDKGLFDGSTFTFTDCIVSM